MMALRWRAVLVVALMALAASVAYLLTPRAYLADRLGKPDLETLFPQRFADWSLDARSSVIQPSPETQAILNSIYNQTLTRTYINSAGYRIMLSVAYGGDQSDATRAHLPEVCYPAQGFQITASEAGTLHLAGREVSARRLMSNQGLRVEPITYWLLVGDRVSNSRTDQKLTQFRLGLQGLIPDGMLVRVSSIDPEGARAYRMQAQFLAEMAQAFAPGAQARVFGSLEK